MLQDEQLAALTSQSLVTTVRLPGNQQRRCTDLLGEIDVFVSLFVHELRVYV